MDNVPKENIIKGHFLFASLFGNILIIKKDILKDILKFFLYPQVSFSYDFVHRGLFEFFKSMKMFLGNLCP